MATDLVIRGMTRAEVDELVSWAAGEGWNPGLHDAALFWKTDAEAFIAAELAGELIGGGAITSYQGEFGFMGLFIVRPEYRGRGFGTQLWNLRRERLLGRLRPGAGIGLDGVFEMQDYYARGGFVFSHRNMRYRAEIPSSSGPRSDGGNHPVVSGGGPPEEEAAKPATHPNGGEGNVVPLSDVPFQEVLEYDRTCFPAPRPEFLEAWTSQPHALALGYLRHGKLNGYGVARRCGEGCKVGPLFAHDSSVAEALYTHLAGFAAGGPLFIDAPENNPAAMALVRRHEMKEVFGCARMYLGPPPNLAHERVFGVTTLELG